MINLQSATVMALVSKESKAKFEKRALESESFRNLITGIESSAEDGKTTFHFVVDRDDDPRFLEIFNDQLKEAGYEVENSLKEPGRSIEVKW